MKVLKHFDLFGTSLTFRVLGQEKYHSYISFSLSVLMLLSTILLTYFFGLDFIFHKESKVLQSTRTSQVYEFYKFKMSDLFFAWRIEGIYGNEINFTDVLYPTIGYYSYKNEEVIKVKYEKCKNFNLSFDIPSDINDYYCSDISNYSIGGSFDNDNKYEYLYINIDICQGNHCPSKEKVMELLNTYDGLYIMIYYPTVSYDPEEKIPYRVSYNKLSVFLDAELITINRFYIRKYIFEDDNGWMLPDLKRNEIFGISEVDSYNILNDLGDGDEIKMNSYIYTGNFYFDKKYSYHKRWFTKAFESLSIISAFYKTLFIIFSWLSSICNKFLLLQIIIARSNDNINSEKNTEIKQKQSCTKNKSILSNSNKIDLSKINLQPFNNHVRYSLFNRNNKNHLSFVDKNKNKSSFSLMKLKVIKKEKLEHNRIKEIEKSKNNRKKISIKYSFYKPLCLYLFHWFLPRDKKAEYEIDIMNRQIFFKKIDIEEYLSFLVKLDTLGDYIKNNRIPTDSLIERSNNIT